MILTDYEKLSQRSEEVETKKENKLIRETIIKLKDIIREKNLTCLSAPEIDVFKRLFVINFNGDLRTFINPILSWVDNFQLSTEECVTLPGKKYMRPRYGKIGIMYETPLGKIEQVQLTGLAAITFQHCLDHLDGLLLCDVGLEIEDDFENASEDEKAEVIKEYLDSIDLKAKEINTQIDNDSNLHQIKEAGEFIKSIKKGETSVTTEQVAYVKKDNEETKDQTDK